MTITLKHDVAEVEFASEGKNDISCIPNNAPPLALFRAWMRASRGLILSILAFVGGESHDVNFFSSLVASKGAML
jgi:hypothetical protein